MNIELIRIPVYRLVTALLAVSVSLSFSSYLHAYDGDVDYGAPYMTVDPKTGKLVTIDPKAQAKAAHAAAAAAASANKTNQGAATSTASQPAATADSTQATQSMPATSQPLPAKTPVDNGRTANTINPNTPLIIAVITVLLVSGYIYISRRKGSVSGPDTGNDNANGRAS